MEKRATRAGKKSVWGVLSTLGILLLGKLKYVLVVFKFLKFKTLFSMFIYLGTYALLFGWKFAIALVYLLFIHEMGHAYAAKKINLPTSPAIFIPFLGAVIGLKEMPKNAKDEAYVAYMGPLFGVLSFLPAIPLYLFTQEPFWALLIVLGGMLNLFNLIPLTPLDGGRIAAGISTKLWGVGLVLLVAYTFLHPNFLLFMLIILGATEWYKLYKKQKSLNENKLALEELEDFIEKIKQETQNLAAIQTLIRKSKWTLPDSEMTNLLNTLDMEIDRMKKELYLQQLSGSYAWNEEDIEANQKTIQGILMHLEEKLKEFNKDIHTTETYYKTSQKTKWKLLLIYIGLAITLSISYYYGNQILLHHPEIQQF